MTSVMVCVTDQNKGVEGYYCCHHFSLVGILARESVVVTVTLSPGAKQGCLVLGYVLCTKRGVWKSIVIVIISIS